jgi:hypothetical protein
MVPGSFGSVLDCRFLFSLLNSAEPHSASPLPSKAFFSFFLFGFYIKKEVILRNFVAAMR